MSTQIQTIDFLAPFDVTGQTSLTAAQIDQLVGGLAPNAGIGLVVVTTDFNPGAGFVPAVPNANTEGKWVNYAWLRILPQNGSVVLYVWNPNLGTSDPTYLNWVTLISASIAPGTITGTQIANQTITSANIASISGSLIVGINTAWLATFQVGIGYTTNGLVLNSMPVFGDLAGAGSTIGNPVIAIGVVTGQNGTAASQIGCTGKAALGTMTGANVAPNTLTTTNMLATAGSL